MLHFNCDYMEGAHPAIIEKLVKTNFEQTFGYGSDPYTESAKEKIRAACGCPDAVVEFLVGGTQANSTVIKAILHVSEGVISADSGHISVHESGAVESTGHKVISLPGHNGKLSADQVRHYLSTFYSDPTYPHMVQPGMVYISHPTEIGTLYSKDELSSLSAVCREFGIPLFMDGARLGYGLASPESDVTLKDIAELCDVFYIGGTKVGALFGEAVVVTNPSLVKNFFTVIKQSGALLAKGRMLGIQFDTLFTDDLYLRISENAISMAMRIKNGFREKGYKFYMDSPTNQQFFLLTEDQVDNISKYATFDIWGVDAEGNRIIRFATSWATKEEDVDSLLSII
ncbi:MAG: low specificity L-threonine aldolase [Oscillospiraceae bacterium]|nr:low specificity L-threonine aldolase [Oscillospiraceae bacterium]